MPSFDIVNEIDYQEVDNAVNQTAKEIGTRFDFRGGESSIEFDKVAKTIKINADDDFKLRSIHQLLEQRMVKRGIDLRLIDYGKEEIGSANVIRQELTLKNGIDKEEAKKILRIIKDSKIKVQAQIQDEQIRVSSKKIDDLQATISHLRGSGEIGLPLQFINMRS